MSEVEQLLQKLCQFGIRIWPQDGKLRYQGSKHLITADLLAQLKQHKDALIRYLCEPTYAPLAYGQKGLWLIQQSVPETFVYNVSFALRFYHPMEPAKWHNAVQLLVNRHGALRTTFPLNEDGPVQQIDGYQAAEFHPVDASDWTEETLMAHLQASHERPFDLTTGPLFRTTIFSHAAEDHVMLFTAHHIAVDGWSIYLLIEELFQIYYALEHGVSSALPAPASSYVDYVDWQKSLIEKEGEQLWAYWQEQLGGTLPVLQLPADRTRPSTQSYRGVSCSFRVPLARTQQLKDVAQAHGCTVYVLLLAAYEVLLYRYSGQDDILIGLTMAGRSQPEFAQVVGYFTSPVVTRADLSDSPSFADLLAQVRRQVYSALDYQDYPFALLVEKLNPPRDPSRPPVFQANFVMQNFHHTQLNQADVLQKSDLKIESIPITLAEGQLDISLEIFDGAEGLEGTIKGNADLFEQSTIERITQHYQVLLGGVVADPQKPIDVLPLLAESERQQILVEWNDTDAQYPRERCIHHFFEDQVTRTPNETALIYESNPGDKSAPVVTLSYHQLNQRANQLAYHLQEFGAGVETLVGLCIERSAEMVVGVLAILKVGAAYVPLDPDLPNERLTLILDDTQSPVVLTQSHLLGSLPAPSSDQHFICVDELPRVDGKATQPNPTPNVLPHNLAYILYTSGSTGRPKGVAVEHSQVVAYGHAVIERCEFEPGMRYAMLQPLTVDSTVTMLYPSLWTGGILHVIDRHHSLDPVALTNTFQHYAIDCLKIAPSHLIALRAASTNPSAILPKKRLVIGGEASQWAWLQELAQESDCHVYNHYGPTETTVGVTTYRVYPQTSRAEEQATSEVSTGFSNAPIGHPLANTQTYILDSAKEPVPIGCLGELYIGGDLVTRGYLHRPELTEEKFIPDPFRQHRAKPTRLYQTGDWARYLPDGAIEYFGRMDDQVKIHGFRIELGEIEAQLLQHPQVADVLVLAKEAQAGEKRLVAYVVAGLQSGQVASGQVASGQVGKWASDETKPANLPPANLRDFLREKLPSHMIPSAFVMLDVLPLSAHGKVNRKALPEPEFVSPRIEAKTVEVQTPTEQLLAEIWQDVLGLEMVGREDNFFEIGGDSISSLQVVSRAQAAGIHLTFRQIFEAQTVAGLAQRVSPAAASAEKSQAEVNIPTGNVLLTPIQRRFFAQPHANLNHVNQSLFIAGEKSLQPELLCQALAYLMQQHDALRLRFKPVSAAGRTFWTQFYAEVTDELESELTSNDVMLEGWLNQIRPSVHMLDLAHLSPDEQQIALEQKNHELQINLNITSGPVWQVASVHLGSDQPDRLLFVIHHLMVDWVSWRILMADLWTIYEQLLAQKTVQLPPKSTSFEQWSTTLHHHAHSPEVLGELDYWVNSRARSVSPLPTDQPFKAEEETLASVETVTCHLSAEETKALLQHVPAVYHTHINDLLMTALVQAFAAWQNAEQDYYCLLLDLERHGREDLDEQIDLSSTVGWFTSIFPLCLELNRGKLTSNPGAAIKSVKEQLRRVPGNGIGYGLLRYLNPESAPLLAALPQAEITFNYGGQFQDGQMDSLGGDRDVGEPLGYRMRIDGGILGDQLLLAWSYSHNLYKRETIERLAQGYIDALSTLIGHCLMPDAGGYTPSDFPDVTIVQAQLDRIVEHIHEMADSAESPRDKAEAKQSIEAIYPLSPSQQGLLFDTLSQKMLTSPTTLGENQPTKEPTGKYLEIFTYDLQGKLDAKAFQQAWQAVVARHPALRTGFYWDGLAEPLQFVLPDIKISIPYQDWQTRSEVEQQTQLQQHLAELHEAGFDMTSPPLMHFALFQVAEDRHIFVWGAHHILKDGWCTQLILGEVIALYEAQREGQQSAQQGELLMSVLPPAPTYQTYIQWLQQQDMGRSERFWRERLSGFDQATPLGEPTQRPAEVLSANHSTNEVDDRTEEKRFGDAYQILSTEVTDSLQTIMRQNHLTLNALVQGTWAILLSRYSGQEDVLFGATVSGRPPTIRQVESIVGLFINTVPVRVAVQPEQPLLDWLQIRQSQALEEDAYAFCSAGQIHGWSDVRGSQPLFESILVFQNYPKMAQSGEGEMGENAAVKAKNAENALTLDLIPIPGYGARTQYALTLQIVTTETLFIQAIYDKLRLSQTDVELILVHWATLLVSIAENPTQTVMQLCNQIPTEQIPTMYPTGRSQESVTYVHPRTAQEQQLVTIWEALLGVQSIGVHDNFFALGGHSLLAMELATRLQETFSHPMPLNLILQYPTVEALSAFLAKSADAHQTGVHHSNTPQNGATNGTTKGRSNDPWISLIALQPNGHKAPFFCVPGVEGNPLYLHSLAQCVGADQPFYALQAIGLDGVTSPHESIEAEAAHYIAEIRQMQQHGPYYVGGHSRGGRVAYAMAQQLKKEGEEIGLLAVMDSGWPGLLDEELANLDDVTFIMSMVDHFSGYQFSNNEAAPRPTMGHIQGEVEIEPTLIGPYLDKQADIYRVLHRLSSEEQFIWLQQQLEALKIIPPGVNKSWVHGLFHVYKNNIRTDCAYQPKPNHSGIKIALFAAQERDAQASKQLDREKQGSGKYAHGTRKKEPSGELLSADELVSGWSQFGQIVLQTIPGNHFSMMVSPNVQVLGKQIGRSLVLHQAK